MKIDLYKINRNCPILISKKWKKTCFRRKWRQIKIKIEMYNVRKTIPYTKLHHWCKLLFCLNTILFIPTQCYSVRQRRPSHQMIVLNSECAHLVIFDLKMIFIFNSSDLIETRKFKICSFRPISPWAIYSTVTWISRSWIQNRLQKSRFRILHYKQLILDPTSK